MGLAKRNKGKVGEREAAELVRDLTGWDARRRVRQFNGDSDLTGVPGWTIEVKRQRTATAAEIGAWWRQAVAQAERAGSSTAPLLLYRADRAEWRARWSLAALLIEKRAECWSGVEWTADTSVVAWAAVARTVAASCAAGLAPST